MARFRAYLDLAGNGLVLPRSWTFTTVANAPPVIVRPHVAWLPASSVAKGPPLTFTGTVLLTNEPSPS